MPPATQEASWLAAWRQCASWASRKVQLQQLDTPEPVHQACAALAVHTSRQCRAARQAHRLGDVQRDRAPSARHRRPKRLQLLPAQHQQQVKGAQQSSMCAALQLLPGGGKCRSCSVPLMRAQWWGLRPCCTCPGSCWMSLAHRLCQLYCVSSSLRACRRSPPCRNSVTCTAARRVSGPQAGLLSAKAHGHGLARGRCCDAT